MEIWNQKLKVELLFKTADEYLWLFLWNNYVTISFKILWQFIQNTSTFFSNFLSGKRMIWFDTADNKFTPIIKWQKTVQQTEVLEITQPSLPGKRKRPAKLLNENEASLYDEVSDVKTFYRRIYFDALDTVTNCMKTWFSQSGYRAIINMERLFLNVINGLEYQNQLENVLSDYVEEINHYSLSVQIQILKTKFVDSNEKTVSPVIN